MIVGRRGHVTLSRTAWSAVEPCKRRPELHINPPLRQPTCPGESKVGGYRCLGTETGNEKTRIAELFTKTQVSILATPT